MLTEKTRRLESMPDKFAYYSSLGVRISGVEPGKFVRIHQGYRRDDNIILHESDEKRKSGDEYFSVFESEPECRWGSGVYLVRKDSTLLMVREDWDSSD